MNKCPYTGKKRFASVKDCKTFINHRPHEHLRHYYCEGCGDYHLTKMKEKVYSEIERGARNVKLHLYDKFKELMTKT